VEKQGDMKSKFPNSRYINEVESYLKYSNKKIQELTHVRHQVQSSKP
jgi:hypothetical protein